MPRFYFDIVSDDGAVVQDGVGVVARDAATAFHECIDTLVSEPQQGIQAVRVRDENGKCVMILNVQAICVTGTTHRRDR